MAALWALLALYGWRTLNDIWGPEDSPSWAYLMFGLPLIAAGVGASPGRRSSPDVRRWGDMFLTTAALALDAAGPGRRRPFGLASLTSGRPAYEDTMSKTSGAK